MEIQSDSTSNFKLWSELELHEFPNKFVIKSIESPDQGFSISRFDGNIKMLDAAVRTEAGYVAGSSSDSRYRRNNNCSKLEEIYGSFSPEAIALRGGLLINTIHGQNSNNVLAPLADLFSDIVALSKEIGLAHAALGLEIGIK